METEERIQEKYTNTSANRRNIYNVVAEDHQITINTMQTDFNFNIPLNQTHQFTSDLFCVQWRLRILLLISMKTHELSLNKTNTNGQTQQTSKQSNKQKSHKVEETEELAFENPELNPQVEPMTLVFPLKIISDGMYVRDIYTNNKHELLC